MAVQKRDKNEKKKIRFNFELSDRARWMMGLVLIFIALYTAYCAVSYMFTWKENQSFVQFGDFLPSEQSVVGGSLSAWIGDLLVGKCFGVFAIVLPIIFVIWALRIIRRLPARAERVGRIALLIMILGSITIGYIANSSTIFGYGLGGKLGTYSATWLHELLGGGIIILLICSWIMLAIYISSRTIDKLDNFGRGIVDAGQKLLHKRESEGDLDTADQEIDTNEDFIEDEEEERVVVLHETSPIVEEHTTEIGR